ncbi:MAG: hypothetical protein KDD53_12670, partial [Bdellovibrionales bacterium]|nr:hypothetical protein [Bdellovibrionales bacterium]
MKLLKSHSLVELPKERRLTEGSCMVEKVESKGIIAQIVPDEGGRRAFDLRWENVPSQLDTDPCLPYWPRPTSHDIHLSPSHSIYKLSLDLGNQSARNCFIELCERLEIKLRKGTTNEEFVYHQLATLPSRQGN